MKLLRKLWLDNPLVRAMLFFPRRATPGTSALADTHDGTIPAGSVEIGYRLYARPDAAALLLCFHGNAEVATDYDVLASLFREFDLALMVADYRGYGWSTGRVRASMVLPDAEAVLHQLPDMLARHGMAGLPLFVHGRSLGGAPAIHLAWKSPGSFRGLILESTFAHAPSVLTPAFRWLPGLFDNGRKIRQIELPLLLMHGERDEIIPVRQGQGLYDRCPARRKFLMRVPNAGHNDLVMQAQERYFKTIRRFVDGALTSDIATV